MYTCAYINIFWLQMGFYYLYEKNRLEAELKIGFIKNAVQKRKFLKDGKNFKISPCFNPLKQQHYSFHDVFFQLIALLQACQEAGLFRLFQYQAFPLTLPGKLLCFLLQEF